MYALKKKKSEGFGDKFRLKTLLYHLLPTRSWANWTISSAAQCGWQHLEELWGLAMCVISDTQTMPIYFLPLPPTYNLPDMLQSSWMTPHWKVCFCTVCFKLIKWLNSTEIKCLLEDLRTLLSPTLVIRGILYPLLYLICNSPLNYSCFIAKKAGAKTRHWILL